MWLVVEHTVLDSEEAFVGCEKVLNHGGYIFFAKQTDQQFISDQFDGSIAFNSVEEGIGHWLSDYYYNFELRDTRLDYNGRNIFPLFEKHEVVTEAASMIEQLVLEEMQKLDLEDIMKNAFQSLFSKWINS